MEPEYLARLARLEQQMSYLLRHLGISEDVAAGGASPWGTTPDFFAAPAASMPGPGGFAVSGSPAGTGGGPGGGTGAGVPPEVLAAMRAGRTIEAIKIYREMTGVGLKEAKIAVEGMERELGLRR